MNSDDDVSQALGALPVADIEPAVSKRIQGRAHVVLASARRYRDRPLLARSMRIYSRAIEPAFVAGACVIYLYWALNTAFSLLH